MTKIAPFPQPNFSIWLWFLTIFRVSVPPVTSRKIAKRVIFCSSWPVEAVLSKFSKNQQLLILGQQYTVWSDTLSNSIKCSFWHCYCHCVCLSLCHCVIVIVSLCLFVLSCGVRKKSRQWALGSGLCGLSANSAADEVRNVAEKWNRRKRWVRRKNQEKLT